jgi:hypothetical protein
MEYFAHSHRHLRRNETRYRNGLDDLLRNHARDQTKLSTGMRHLGRRIVNITEHGPAGLSQIKGRAEDEEVSVNLSPIGTRFPTETPECPLSGRAASADVTF